ncbi:SWIM zinc finger family protein [Macrococcoides caseolyticum]|uniref:SWIM zinc finger family protein n=1 Tax=Macrococcoides caseolyticum TaxID=69966 RepID=UPI000C325E78|nr:hypothetical protein [Macrococcus caseolyticus]PKD97677.1 hypothetical protein CW719_10605 [Macrococcus caseolyticus]PKE19363.1 hypothetical protein CW679_05455 [Macrococcus caseolyticus]PKF18214.1 hypothetical protein CW717_10600 [Macrococcus caseolyticus]PKF40874.1 hypothetical protein CW661_05195 [Macrococcus caseolyticus]QYA35077.1 hypothetical protein KYI08_10530 [Macrococcus caseolyticus]
MNWRSYFKPIILERGKMYYEDDLVEVAYVDKTSINTIVYGTEEYEVEIENIGTDDMTMICDCPYALDDDYCKHIAASMMVFEELEGTIQKTNKKKQIKIDQNVLLQTLTHASEVDVKSFLFELCMKNSDIYEKFMKEIAQLEAENEAKLHKPQSLQTYKEEIRDIYKSYMRRNFIDYTDAMHMFNELESYLEDEVPKLYDYPVRAIKMLNYAVMLFGKYDIDDSAGGYTSLMNLVTDLSSDIIDEANDKQQDEIFNIYLELLKGELLYEREMIEEIFFEHFESEAQLNAKLIYLERSAAQATPDSYAQKNTLEHLIIVYEELGLSSDEIILKLKPYRHTDQVRDFLIEVEINKGHHKKVVELIKEGMQSKYPGIARMYHALLIRYLKDIGHTDYVYELFNYVIREHWSEMESYRELKSFYTQEEWEQVRQYIFRKSNDEQLAHYFIEEKLYDRLLKGFKEGRFYYRMFLHMKEDLLSYDKEKSLHVYAQIINTLAVNAKSRKEYKGVMRYLQDMKQITGGEIIAHRIAKEWRILYKKRPAMIDELNKVMK